MSMPDFDYPEPPTDPDPEREPDEDEAERLRLITLFGKCRVCGAPRKDEYRIDGDGVHSYGLYCTFDDTHEREA